MNLNPLHEDIWRHLPGTGWRCDDAYRDDRLHSIKRLFKYDPLDLRLSIERYDNTTWNLTLSKGLGNAIFAEMNAGDERLAAEFWRIVRNPKQALMEAML